MIVKQYIKDFEKLGFGMFVHFGLYSIIGEGEWVKHTNHIPDEEYEPLVNSFDPDPDWAKELVATAKQAGCRYITLTTRHHDGFSLYDTCGLTEYDAMHAACKRDLVREFVDACRNAGIIPFFYHTLLDWHVKSYQNDFKAYLAYLRRSVEILCTNYGKIGGLWFDGMWDRPDDDWEEDALYATIRKYQPEAMIINNTGLSHLGELGHIELDSVTFERGKPSPINLDGSPKYIASEMCEIFNECWGYGRDDINYKAPAQIIEELADCRRYCSNFLMNVGPLPTGQIRPIDAAIFGLIGHWTGYFDEAIHDPYPTGIVIENKPKDFILQKDEKTYYLFCYDLPMVADPNVAKMQAADFEVRFRFDGKIRAVTFMDNNESLRFRQQDGETVIETVPYTFGRNLVVRVARIDL